MNYTIMRIGDGEERYYAFSAWLDRGLHPWVFNRALAEPMFRISARFQVWLLNRYTTKFKYKVVSFKGNKK